MWLRFKKYIFNFESQTVDLYILLKGVTVIYSLKN